MKCETPVSPASAGNTGSASGTRSPGGEVVSQLIDKAAGGSPSEGSTFAKLLVSNVITGTLIGKNGGTINAIRTQTGCNVKVSTSGPQGFFPGTSDRIVVLIGSRHALEQAITYILVRACMNEQIGIFNEQSALKDSPANLSDVPRTGGPENVLELRFVVPNSTVSLIIGKSGVRINQLRDTTGAKIQISSRDASGRMDSERIINISGDFEHVRKSALTIAAIIQEDPSLRDFMHTSYPSRAEAGGAGPTGLHSSPSRGAAYAPYGEEDLPTSRQSLSTGARPAHMGGSGFMGPSFVLDVYSEIYLQIPDECVGSLVGRSGQHLCDIRSTSGARVSISQRGELVPGTRDRLVTVTGPIRSVHAAHILIMQRLADLQESLRNDALQH